MKFSTMLLLIMVSLTGIAGRAGELAPEVAAKFLKVIVTSSGGTKIACSDPAIKAALEAQGVVVDAGAQIVWAVTVTEARAGKQFGRLVITAKRELAASASILLEEDGGHPKILVNSNNLRSSKVQLGDAILKIAGTL
jgi:hypothetical protein